MSLYTPVFPPTDPPADRSPSSSLSSVETQKHERGLSYSSRLAQWHLAIAGLPYELCPPSAPPSPTSQARSVNLQSEIEKAVREGRNITDFVKLRSTKLGYATKQPAHGNFEQGDGVPWILAETEEEWLEWEREVARRRTLQKGKERAPTLPTPNTPSQDAHDKVVNWKASLLPSSASPVTASPAPLASTGRSSLGFPVVKRSTMVKGNKLKANKCATQIGSAPKPSSETQPSGDVNSALRVDGRAINAAHVDTGGVEHGISSSELRLDLPKDARSDSYPNEVSQNVDPEASDFPPPSFPADLITSTQKDVVDTARSLHQSPFPRTIVAPQSQKDGDRLETVENEDNAQDAKMEPISQTPVAGNGLINEVVAPQIPQATPPSPPYSSETSQKPVQQDVVRPDTEHSVPAASPQQETARPITPPPETDTVLHVSNEMQVQSSPRTPERTPRQGSENNSNHPISGVGSTKNRMEVNGHMTPDAAINGVSVARGMLFPRTPERRSQVPTDPLTTSRKSRPRPRPPSRKQSVQNMNPDLDGAASEAGDGPDPSPAKSDRSYFSSPASGSSSDSELSQGSMLFVRGSPNSPLDFAGNLSRFAPLAHSTQVNSRNAPSSPTPSHSRRESQNQTQSQKGVFDSQFDVDARVDELSNFMRQDVDLDAWVRATDNGGEADGEDEDDDSHDDFAVEEMTKPYPLSL